MSDQPRPRYLLELEARPDPVPPEHRLRALLKRALRSFKFRCVRVTPLDPPAPPPQEEQPR